MARRLPATSGRTLVSAANHAYVHGMIEVAVISAIVLSAGALLVLLFLPAARPLGGETRDPSPSNVVNPGIHSAGGRSTRGR